MAANYYEDRSDNSSDATGLANPNDTSLEQMRADTMRAFRDQAAADGNAMTQDQDQGGAQTKTQAIAAQGQAPVSVFIGDNGRGLTNDAARLLAGRQNRINTDGRITYFAEEHGDPSLPNKWAMVGRRVVGQSDSDSAQIHATSGLSPSGGKLGLEIGNDTGIDGTVGGYSNAPKWNTGPFSDGYGNYWEKGGINDPQGRKVALMDDILKQREWAQVLRNKKRKDELTPYPIDRVSKPMSTSVGNTDQSDPEFIIGSASPRIRADSGSGQWGSEMPEKSSYLKKQGIVQSVIPYARLLYPDAADHLQHFFDNTGTDYQVNLQRIVETTDAGRDLYLSQRNAAMDFATAHAVDGAPLSFVSQILEQRRFSNDENWMRASGTFSGWSNATITKNGDQYSMDFDLHYFDPYNWNTGQSFPSFGVDVKDSSMALFHRQGLAKDYNLVGSLPLTITWQAGHESDFSTRIRR